MSTLNSYNVCMKNLERKFEGKTKQDGFAVGFKEIAVEC